MSIALFRELVSKWDSTKHIDFCGLRIRPRALNFANCFIGAIYKEKIMLQNVSAKPIRVKTTLPLSSPICKDDKSDINDFLSLISENAFKLDKSMNIISLSSGLSTNLWVTFCHTKNSNITTEINIYVNDDCYIYILSASMTVPYLYTVPCVIDFGKINLAHAIHTEKLKIFNNSYKTSKFEFDLATNPLGLLMEPMKGYVEPNNSAEISVSIIGIEEGVFCNDIWIKCDHPFRFTVTVQVIKPKLYISGVLNYTEAFLPIKFPQMYGNCQYYQPLTIFNYNLLDCNFIIVPELNMDVMTLHKVRELEPTYDSFVFSPAEGLMRPNEKKSINISFSPKGTYAKSDRVFFVCYRLIRLEIMSIKNIMLLKDQKKSNSLAKNSAYSFDEETSVQTLDFSINEMPRKSVYEVSETQKTNDYDLDEKISNHNIPSFDEFIRLCLFAIVKPVEVKIKPQLISLGKLNIHEKRTVSVKIYNNSLALPIYFEYKKTAYINAEPIKGRIAHSSFVDIELTINPKSPGYFESVLNFDLLYHSVTLNEKKHLVVVGTANTAIEYNVGIVTITPASKINPGITPKITNEVGILTDDIRFNTQIDLPEMTMHACFKKMPSKKLDSSKIAFPNDRPTSLVPYKPTQPKCKTIFAGLPRTSAPPDIEYSGTLQQILKRQANIDYYDRYILNSYLKRNASKSKNKGFPDYYDKEDKLLLKVKKPSCPKYYKMSIDPVNNEYQHLTPIQTYFVHVKPTKIHLGKVSVFSNYSFKLKIANDNKFPCHVELKTLCMDKRLFPSLPSSETLKGSSSCVFEEIFFQNKVGLFNTILNLTINNNHLLPIPFKVDVVRPFVHLEQHEVIFDDNECGHVKYLKLINTLNIDLEYKWHLPKNISYKISPLEGVIPVNRFTMCEIEYKPDISKRSDAKMHCCCIGGSSTSLTLNAYLLKCDAEFLQNDIDVGYIPINMPVTRYNVLRNHSMDTISFFIKNTKPCFGVTVEPATGTIWGKSDFYIKILIYYQVFVKFECKVEAEFDHGNILLFTLKGMVDIPKLNFYPDLKKISLRRIAAESFDIFPFSITNKGRADVFISFDETLFPEIKVYDSIDCIMDRCKYVETTLSPNQTIELYLHFYPLDVCMNEFYLPIIINNIIGPPFKGEPESTKISTYIDNFVEENKIQIEEYSLELLKYKGVFVPLYNCVAISSRHVLRFNKTKFKFKYSPVESFQSKTMQELKIVNSFPKTIEFSINTDGISPYFEIQPNDKKIWQYFNNYIFCVIDPDEEVSLNITFDHLHFGVFVRNLEVYIKDIKHGSVFSYITLIGHNLEPIIDVAKYVFLEPVQANTNSEKSLVLYFRNHIANCKLSIDCDQDVYEIIQEKNNVISEMEKEVRIKIKFQSRYNDRYYGKLVFSCTCGAKSQTLITCCVDDNITVIYTHIGNDILFQTNSTKYKCYPMFPDINNNSKYAVYMRHCKLVVERWLFEQVLHKTHYYFIPESLTGLAKTSSKSKNQSDVLAIVKIIQNICGSDVLSFLITRPYPSTADESEIISYKHSVFKNAIKFLKAQGAYFPHVRAKFLLDYSDYVIYVTTIRKILQKTVLVPATYTVHYSRTQQCWLDFILQLFNTLVLKTIVFRKFRFSTIFEDIQERVALPDSQVALIAWMNEIFKTQLMTLNELDCHKPPDFVLKPRVIANFTFDLNDGLVLVAITLNFCPYLKFILKDIYINVDSTDKAFHNAILLVKAWNLMKCSFTITPTEIINPSAIQMLMFLTYLHTVFPNFVPKEELDFTVDLTFTETKEVFIRNSTNFELHFEVCFINNEMDCFQTTPSNFLTVLPGKDCKVIVEYRAKKMESQSTTLVFSGDVPGQMYCKSLVYQLNGSTVYRKEYANFVFEVDLYTMIKKEIIIESPYKYPAIYDIIIGKSNLANFEGDKIHSWKHKHKLLKPHSLYCDNYKLITDDKGIGTLNITLCCSSIDIVEKIMVFINKNVGDFLITVVVQPLNFHKIPKFKIEAEIPDNWDQIKCLCERNRFSSQKKCPRRIPIYIPCKNDHFWEIISKSILLSVPEKEKKIWMENLNCEMGPYLLNWLLVVAEESSVKHFYDSDITYKIYNTNYGIDFPRSVKVTNIRAPGAVKIFIHLQNNVSVNKIQEFALQSEDGAEYRIYNITFRKKRNSNTQLL